MMLLSTARSPQILQQHPSSGPRKTIRSSSKSDVSSDYQAPILRPSTMAGTLAARPTPSNQRDARERSSRELPASQLPLNTLLEKQESPLKIQQRSRANQSASHVVQNLQVIPNQPTDGGRRVR